MKYYKVKPEAGNVRYSVVKNGHREWAGILVGNELYTAREWFNLKTRTQTNLDRYADEIECNPKKTYFFFGARFMMKGE